MTGLPICLLDEKTGKGSCGSVTGCEQDDSFEDSDDGPHGATFVDAAPGAAVNVVGHNICGVDGEADWFLFNLTYTGNVKFTADWSADAADIDLKVFTPSGRLLGLSLHQRPEAVTLTHLRAGSYLIQVTRASGSMPSLSVPYVLSITPSGAPACTGVADCAAEYATQLFRGRCDAPSGACDFVDGHGVVPDGGVCDHHLDCASGVCSSAVSALTSGADKRSFCTQPCDSDATCSAPLVCTTAFMDNLCGSPCQNDEECPPVFEATPPGGGAWQRLFCKSGHCTP